MAKSNGTAVAAFFAVAFGVWLVDAGIQGRHPIKTLEDIIKNPSNVKGSLASSKGQFTPVSDLVGSGTSSTAAATVTGNNSAGIPSPAAASGSVKQEQDYAAKQLQHYGWGQDQMPALIDLWNQESGWNPLAVNPGQIYNGDPSSLTNHAHGIPQSLGHSETDTDAWMRNYKAQIDWGLNYIKNAYGSPDKAEQHELANHWY